MGIEDSDSDNDEERVVPSVDDKQNSDICYDDIPNGADVTIIVAVDLLISCIYF